MNIDNPLHSIADFKALKSELLKKQTEIESLVLHDQEQKKLINNLRIKIDRYRAEKKVTFSWRKVKSLRRLLPYKLKLVLKKVLLKIQKINFFLLLLLLRMLRKLLAISLHCLRLVKYIGGFCERSLIFICQKLDKKINKNNGSRIISYTDIFKSNNRSRVTSDQGHMFLTERADEIYTQFKKELQRLAREEN